MFYFLMDRANQTRANPARAKRCSIIHGRYTQAQHPFASEAGRIIISPLSNLIARYGDSESLMYSAIVASGAEYMGRNERFWEHQGEARVTRGYNTPEFVCKKQSDSSYVPVAGVNF